MAPRRLSVVLLIGGANGKAKLSHGSSAGFENSNTVRCSSVSSPSLPASF